MGVEQDDDRHPRRGPRGCRQGPSSGRAGATGHNAWRIDAGHDELVEDYRRARGEHDDPLAVELGVIAGLVMYGWVFGHSAAWHPDPAERRWSRKELAWWVPRARRALDTWSPG